MFAEFEGRKSHRPGVARALGIVLRERRGQLGLAIKAVASRAFLNDSYIGMLERGERQPTIAVFIQLARALELDPAALLDVLIKKLKQELAAPMPPDSR